MRLTKTMCPHCIKQGGEWYPPEAWKTVQAAVKAAIEEAKPYDLELPFITAKGRHIWVRTQGFPVQVDGKVTKIEGTFQDITEQKYRDMETKLITDSLGIGVWKFDPLTNQLEWDRSMYTLYGLDPKEFSGAYSAWENALTPEAKAAAVEELQLALKGEKDFNTTFEIQLKSGEKRYISARATVMRNENKEPIKMYGVNWDVTEEKKSKLELKSAFEHLEIYKAVLDNANDFIGIADQDMNPTYLNPSGRKMVGLSIEQDITKLAIAECYPEELRNTVVATIASDLKTKGIWSGETEFRNFVTNERIAVSDVHFSVKDPKTQSVLGYATITRDIRMEKKRQKESEELSRQLDLERLKSVQTAKLASLGEMSAGIAHEINNPLAIVSGAVNQIIKYANDPEKLSEKIETIKKAVGRISKIVVGLKKFSRSSAGKNIYKTHNLSNIIEETLILTSVKAKQNSTIVHKELKSQSEILCDEVEIEQVLINLINNAVDAVKECKDKWVKIELFDENNSVVLRVSDSGPGIPDSISQKIFEPFFTTKAVGQGTGLGLSISKGILEEHGASLQLMKNSPNTCFEIRFKRAGVIRAAA